MSNKISLLIVDDSKIFQNLLKKEMGKIHEFDLLGVANNPIEASRIIRREKPDFMILDVEMPYMSGIEFLIKQNEIDPIPTIILTGISEKSKNVAIEAMEAGALHVVLKPTKASDVDEVISDLRSKIIELIKPRKRPINSSMDGGGCKDIRFLNKKVIAIGSSTGGVQALSKILPQFSKDTPPIIIVQHMPPGFTETFSIRLNSLCEMNVKEARKGDVLERGCIYLAPGGEHHMTVHNNGKNYYLEVNSGERVNRHSPSVDVLFDSVAENVGQDAVAIVLTGMGSDGAKGLAKIANNMGKVYVQDESTSVVYGMPKVAYELTPSAISVGLNDIPRVLMNAVSNNLLGGEHATKGVF